MLLTDEECNKAREKYHHDLEDEHGPLLVAQAERNLRLVLLDHPALLFLQLFDEQIVVIYFFFELCLQFDALRRLL